MFKVGDEAKGFKFDDGTDGVGYDTEMDDYVEEIGVVVDVYTDSFVMQFPDSLEWMYPASLAHLAKVGEEIPLKIGEEVPFKKGDRVVVVAAQPPEGEYKNGDKGTVVNLSYQDRWVDVKIDGSESLYSTMYFSEVQKDTSLNTKDETSPSFQAGDRVKFTESSLASGMIDAKEDDVFTVKESYKRAVTLEELQGCYHVTHLEHVKEEVMNNTEDQEIEWEGSQIDWQVGQEVFCLLRGKGVVDCVGENDETPYVVGVDFGYTFDNYTIDGKIMDDHFNRVLFFSEPKIEAEKYPPKKPFVPVFKKGDRVVVTNIYNGYQWIDIVEEENEDCVTTEKESAWLVKSAHKFYKIGEEITFN